MEMNINITESNNESLAYRLIRIKARNMLEPCTDQELGQYVRGIVENNVVNNLWVTIARRFYY